MAETVWQSGPDGDFALASNWSNGVPGTAAGLIGVLDDTSHTTLAKNLDQSGAANSFSIKSTRAYLGNIGASGNPLIIKNGALELAFTIRSQGNSYVSLSGATTSDILVDAQNGFVQVNEGAGVLQNLMVKSGRATVPAASTPQFIFVTGENTVLTVDAASATLGAQFDIENGIVHCARNIGGSTADNAGFTVGGGEIWMTGLLVQASTEDPTSLCVVKMTGAYFNYNPVGDASDVSPDLILMGGWFDASDAPSAVTLDRLIKGLSAKLTGAITANVIPDYDLTEDWP